MVPQTISSLESQGNIGVNIVVDPAAELRRKAAADIEARHERVQAIVMASNTRHAKVQLERIEAERVAKRLEDEIRLRSEAGAEVQRVRLAAEAASVAAVRVQYDLVQMRNAEVAAE